MKIVFSEVEFINMIGEAIDKLTLFKGHVVASVDLSTYKKDEYATIEMIPVAEPIRLEKETAHE